MYGSWFTSEKLAKALEMLRSDFPYAVWETIYLTLISTAIATVIGMFLGVILVAADNKILKVPKSVIGVLNVLINLLRSVPFVILLVLCVPLTRLIMGVAVGTDSLIPPLVIAAFPFIARLVESSLREVNHGIIEAAQSMGATPFQIIVKVLIPEALPSLISNITIALTTILGYTAMSSTVAGGGLGGIAITRGYSNFNYYVIVFAVVLLIVIVQFFQSLGTVLAKKVDRRAKR